jgi:Ni/Fe-hydrogenase subunit HybB-like protein
MSRRLDQRKWGIRSLLFLGLAAGSIILSNWMRMTGNTDVILLTFIGTVVGLAGATVATIRGLRAWGGRLPREEPPPDRRQRP